MKTYNIDALRQRAAEIGKEYDALVEKNQAILDAAMASKGMTAEQESEFNKNTDAAKKLKSQGAIFGSQIKEIEEVLAREKGQGSGKDITSAAGGDKGEKKPLWVKGLAHQLQAVAAAGRGGRIDPRLTGVYGDYDASGVFQASGGSDGLMNEAVPAEGGFLVGADYSEKIYQRTYLTGEITRRCTRQPISSNSNRLKLRVVDETSRADGYRMGGVIAYWENEADTLDYSKPKFRMIELNLKKLTALVGATDELLEDVAALEAWIMNNMPTELAFRIEDALFSGSGAGIPQGLLNSPALLKLSPGGTATVINGTDVIAMLARFWFPGLKNMIPAFASENLVDGKGVIPAAAWFIDQSTIPQLFQLQMPSQNGAGQSTSATIMLYHPPGSNPFYGPYGELFGLPVIPTEHNAQLGTIGDIILADMSQYLLADKGAPKVAASMHVRFLQDEMVFRWTLRVDAQSMWNLPLTPKSGGPTLSPFVVLNSGASR